MQENVHGPVRIFHSQRIMEEQMSGAESRCSWDYGQFWTDQEECCITPDEKHLKVLTGHLTQFGSQGQGVKMVRARKLKLVIRQHDSLPSHDF